MKTQHEKQVFAAFSKIDRIWDLCLFKNISFYNEYETFLSACFSNVANNDEVCLLSVQAEAKTYLCSKTPIFTMSYEHFFKSVSFSNENTSPSTPSRRGAVPQASQPPPAFNIRLRLNRENPTTGARGILGSKIFWRASAKTPYTGGAQNSNF